ncbi:transposase [Micrococcus luteus]|uniref:transposase n=1 Tax=Micrococcus luteus TaxID=1270 RepID=UPI003879552E
MSELTADAIPVTVTFRRGLKIARQSYCRWPACPVTDTEFEQACVAIMRSGTHRDVPEFGCRFLAGQSRDAGFSACGRTMWRICSTNGWWGAFRKKRGKNGKKPRLPIQDDLVNRDFTADTPHQLWLAKITEPRAGESRLCLCAIKDVFVNRILGYSISNRTKSCRAVEALNSALVRRGNAAGCILRTDRGSQFHSRKLVRALTRHGLTGSMGKVSVSGYKTVIESFVALLQKYVLDRCTWATRQELRIAIVIWTERAYRRRRR